MANYGRQGSNLAQFMREQLNTVQPNEPEEDIRFDDLDVFTNTEFYDFDTHMRTDFKPASDSPPSSKPEPTSATSIMGGEFGSMDLIDSAGRSRSFFIFTWEFLCLFPPCGVYCGACVCVSSFSPCVSVSPPGELQKCAGYQNPLPRVRLHVRVRVRVRVCFRVIFTEDLEEDGNHGGIKLNRQVP